MKSKADEKRIEKDLAVKQIHAEMDELKKSKVEEINIEF